MIGTKEEVHFALGVLANVLGQSDGGEVADGDLVRGGVLDNLRAKVRGADGTEVLLVRLAVAAKKTIIRKEERRKNKKKWKYESL